MTAMAGLERVDKVARENSISAFLTGVQECAPGAQRMDTEPGAAEPSSAPGTGL